jgi:hypothetical protein
VSTTRFAARAQDTRQDQDHRLRPDWKRAPLDLAKLRPLVARLDIDTDDHGIVLDVVERIRCCLDSTGHTFSDLLLGAAEPQPHREAARAILAHDDVDALNAKEREFVRVMSRSRFCSDRQNDWLESIYYRFF